LTQYQGSEGHSATSDVVHSREQKYTCKYDKTINLINKLLLIITQKQYDCYTETMHVFRKYVSKKHNIRGHRYIL
jgi:hypothetical protein